MAKFTMSKSRWPRVLVAAGLLLSLAGMDAQAQQKVRFAYLKSTTLIPFFFAMEKGYFKAEGLDIEAIAVPGGPAVAAAIAGGSADIGYAAPTPIAIARQAGQPYRFFIGLEREVHPNDLWGTILASEKSGIKSLKELAGKKVTLGPPGGLCELAVRDWLGTVGLKWSDITPLHQPFPQMQAALEVGNADAACIIEPFTTAVQGSNVKPVTLTRGYISPPTERYTVDGIFASEAWLAANGKTVEGIRKAMLKAWQELAKDRVTIDKILDTEFRFPKALAGRVKLDFVAQLSIDAKDFEPLIQRMKKHGMLKPDFKTEDLVQK
jgi:ABC-type nitrate/sulfonate/bicarbonate transport system substrate-binding protein